MPVVSRRLDLALPPSAFAGPDTSERWVKGKLHFILEIEESQVEAEQAMRAHRWEAESTGQPQPGAG